MMETTIGLVGAQTQLFPRPGAVSFKRLLDGNLPEIGNGTCGYTASGTEGWSTRRRHAA
jgi:hypothetical protein